MFRKRGLLTLRREDGRIVAEEVRVANTIGSRTIGLLGRRSLPPGQGIVLRPAFSIHTAFMRFPIDAIFLDADLVVVKIAADLRRARTASCRGAREVVELAAGECERRGLSVGDRVAWAAHVVEEQNGRTPSGALGAPSARVLIASRDARFVKLIRFLLDGKALEGTSVTPEGLPTALESDDDVEGVILDANESLAPALAIANAARTLRPETPIVLVAESEAAARAPDGARVYDKWNETDELIAALESQVARSEAGADAVDADRDV
jgi:uncharacterized membrane protein (UPF0127 family)